MIGRWNDEFRAEDDEFFHYQWWFCIENDEFRIANDEFRIANDEFCIENDDFVFKTMNSVGVDMSHQVSKNDEFRIQKEEFRIQNDEFCNQTVERDGGRVKQPM